VNPTELKEFLDFKAATYEQPHFLEQDPIQLPHRFQKKEDIEITGFLVATFAWGNRLSIIKSGMRMLELMGRSLPFCDGTQTQGPEPLGLLCSPNL